jgi:hypothetical protein
MRNFDFLVATQYITNLNNFLFQNNFESIHKNEKNPFQIQKATRA